MTTKESCIEGSGYVVPIPTPGPSAFNGLYFSNGSVSPTYVLGVPGHPVHRSINACTEYEEGTGAWFPKFTKFEVNDTYANLEPLTGNKNLLHVGLKTTKSPSKGVFYKPGYDSDRDGYSEVGGVFNVSVPLVLSTVSMGAPSIGAFFGLPGAAIGGGIGAVAFLGEKYVSHTFGDLTMSFQFIAEPDALIDMVQESVDKTFDVLEDVVSDVIDAAEEAAEFAQQVIEKVDWIRDKANEIIDLFDGDTTQTVQAAYNRLQSLMV